MGTGYISVTENSLSPTPSNSLSAGKCRRGGGRRRRRRATWSFTSGRQQPRRSGVRVLAEVHELFRAFLAIVHQFESEHAASRVDVNPGRICKQTSALRADTPIDHVADDLRSAFDGARLHHGAVGELDLVVKLEELPSRLGIQGDHGPLAVLIPDEHDSIADAQCPKGLPAAQSPLDAVVRRSLPQDLARAGIHGMDHAVDGLESSMIVEHGESIGSHIGWRIY